MNRFRFSRNSPDIRKIIDEIESIVRSNFNDNIILCLAIDKEDTAPKPSFIKIEFLAKDAQIPENIEYDYGNFIIIKKSISYQEFIDILYHIEEQTECGIRPVSNHVVKIDGWDRMYVSSNQSWGYAQPEFPSLYFQGRLNQQTCGFIPNEVLAAKGIPPYPNAYKAISDICDLRAEWNVERTFLIVIPDYRARIKTVKISNNKIQAEIDARYIVEKDLLCQFYVGGNKQMVSNSAVEIKNNVANLSLKGEPEHILVILMTKLGEILDKKEFSMTYLPQDSSVIVEIPSYSLMEMIKNGEGRHVEFKSKLGSPEPFITSVISFSNTEGGRIFIGVDDYGEIVGIEDPEVIKSTISNWIAQYCDPRMEVKSTYSMDLNIIVVEVPVGSNRPYFLKTGGCFVRHGSTDRQATRTELESMKKPTNTMPGYI